MHTAGEGQGAQELSHAWTHPGEGTAEHPAPKALGHRRRRADAQDTGCMRQLLPRAPKTLCSGEGTETARQPARKDLRTDLAKGYTELKYRNRERKRRAIQRQPRGEEHPGQALSGGTQGRGCELGGGWEGAGRVRGREACSCLLWGPRRGFGFYSESGGKPSVTKVTSGSHYKKRRGCGSQVEAGSGR